MCGSPLWSRSQRQDSSRSESLVGLQGGFGEQEGLWEELALQPRHSDEPTRRRLGGGRILIASAAPAKKHGVEKGACGGLGVNNPPLPLVQTRRA